MPVIGYQTEELPAFYTRESGFKVDYRLESPAAIAEALRLKWELGLAGGAPWWPTRSRPSLQCPRPTSTPPLPRHCERRTSRG